GVSPPGGAPLFVCPRCRGGGTLTRSASATQRPIQPVEHPRIGELARQWLAVEVRALGRGERDHLDRSVDMTGELLRLPRPELLVLGVGDEQWGGDLRALLVGENVAGHLVEGVEVALLPERSRTEAPRPPVLGREAHAEGHGPVEGVLPPCPEQ